MSELLREAAHRDLTAVAGEEKLFTPLKSEAWNQKPCTPSGLPEGCI